MTPTASIKPDLKVAPEPALRPAEVEMRTGDHDGGSSSDPIAQPSGLKRVLRGTFQLLLPIMVLAVGWSVYNYLKSTRPEAPKRTAKPNIYAVQAVPVKFATVRPELTLYGSTVAGRQVEIRSLVSGQVQSTSPDLRDGGKIAAGSTILTIDPFNYKTAIEEADAQANEIRAKIKEFEASLAVDTGNLIFAREQEELAVTDLGRAEPLSRRGAVTERTVDDRRLLLNQRRQAIAQLTNNIEVWKARIVQQEATLKRLETARSLAARRLAETELTAPFNAYVTDVGAQVGRMVGVNDRVATLIDRDWIEVAFTVTDSQFGRLARGREGLEGRPVEVRWNVGDQPIIYNAKIDRVGANVTSQAGGVQLYARVEKSAEGVGLRPGAFVEVRVPDTEFTEVARLPSTSIFNGDTVFAIKDGQLVSRKIDVVATSGSDVLVRGEIQPGDQVMTTRLSLPGDGVRVKVTGSTRPGDGEAAAAKGVDKASGGGRTGGSGAVGARSNDK